MPTARPKSPPVLKSKIKSAGYLDNQSFQEVREVMQFIANICTYGSAFSAPFNFFGMKSLKN